MEHKTPAGRRPGSAAPLSLQRHRGVLDRRKQKLSGAVSTSDGANPNLAALAAAYSRARKPRGFQLFTVFLFAAV